MDKCNYPSLILAGKHAIKIHTSERTVPLYMCDYLSQLGHEYYQVILSFIKVYLHSTSKYTPTLYSIYDCVPTLKNNIDNNTQLEDNYLIFVIINIANLNLYLSISPLSLYY